MADSKRQIGAAATKILGERYQHSPQINNQEEANEVKQNSTTAHAIPAATLLIALTRTSTEVQEAAASLLLLGAEMFPWMNIAIQSEIAKYLKEQKAEDEWIEREALLDEHRMLISHEAYYTDARYQ